MYFCLYLNTKEETIESLLKEKEQELIYIFKGGVILDIASLYVVVVNVT